MASIVLSYAAGALAEGAGAAVQIVASAVGAAIGSYIDQTFLFPPPDIEGPTVGDLRGQTASEGMPLNFNIGPRVRVPARVVWVGPKFLYTKGDGRFFSHVALDLGGRYKHSDDAYDADAIREVYANGQLIYKEDPYVEVVSDKIRCEIVRIVTYSSGTVKYEVEFISEAGGPDMTEFVSGSTATVSGFSDTENNGAWRVLAAFSRSVTESAIRCYTIVRTPSDEASGNTITISQTPPTFNKRVFFTMRKYVGESDQLPDVTWENVEGEDIVPPRRGRVYAMLVQLLITRWGNSVPNFEVVLRTTSGSVTLAHAIDVLMGRTGLDSSFWDTSAVTGNFQGLTAEEPIDTLGLLQVVMLAYRVMAREVDGKLVFYMRSAADAVEIAQNDLAVAPLGSEPQERYIRFEDTDDSELHSRVEVEFTNSDNGMQKGNARPRVQGFSAGRLTARRVRLPLTLTEQGAANVAQFLTVTEHAARQKRQATLPMSYLQVAEGDVWKATIDGEEHISIATTVEYGADGTIHVSGRQEQQDIIDLADSEFEVGVNANGTAGIDYPLYLDLYLLDVAPLRDEDATRPGLYYACPYYDQAEYFQGGALWRQLEGATEFVETDPIERQVAAGYVTSTDHASTTVSAAYWDRVSELYVTPNFGSQTFLTTATEEAVLGGENWCVYGKEVIGFTTATLQGDGRYLLQGLLRGLKGTEHAISTHTGAELFVPLALVNDATAHVLSFHQMPVSALSTDVDFKAVGDGWDEADVDEQTAGILFECLKPFPVYAVTGTRNGSNDLTVTWERQTRLSRPIWSPTEAPLVEAVESYEVDVIDGGSPTSNSPYVVDSTKTFDYTAALQTADGLTPGDPVDLKVYQIGASVGRGRVKEATV